MQNFQKNNDKCNNNSVSTGIYLNNIRHEIGLNTFTIGHFLYMKKTNM